MLSKNENASPPVFVHLPKVIYASGNSVEGEVEINIFQSQEDNIEEVQVELRGTSSTYV